MIGWGWNYFVSFLAGLTLLCKSDEMYMPACSSPSTRLQGDRRSGGTLGHKTRGLRPGAGAALHTLSFHFLSLA